MLRLALAATMSLALFLPAAARDLVTADTAIRERMVRESVAEYLATGHPCACPYNSAQNGSSCGRRSAYSRPGGAAPLCYPRDVTAEMVAGWRASH